MGCAKNGETWVKELTRSDPGSWRKEGLQLLEISRICDDQGGDNRLHSSIETEVAAAAFRCGPVDAWSFFNWVNIETERYWLQTVREVMISASRRVIKDKSVSDQIDVLGLWCCAIGVSRWFDEHQAQKITALRDVILATVPDENRPDFLDRMRLLTPGEIVREKYDSSRPKSKEPAHNDSQDAEPNDTEFLVAGLVERVTEGYGPSFKEIGHLALRVAQENPKSREKLMEDLFAISDGNRDYLKDWNVPPCNGKTWSHFTSYVLRRLLSSDSAETVSAAIRGLNAVVEVSPEILEDIFEDCDEKQLLRLLLGMEVWAARHPKFAGPVLGRLWESVEQQDLRNRIQLWICALFYSNATGDSSLSKSFRPDPVDDSEAPEFDNIIVPPKRLLKVGAKDDGCVKISNPSSATRHWLYRLKAVADLDTESLEATIAKALETQSSEDKKPSPKDRFAVEDGDMVIVNQIDEILDDALYHELRSPSCMAEDDMNVAIAVTHGDDPWLLQQSPIPSPSSFDWPEAQEVDEWLESGKDRKNVRHRLQQLLKGGLEQDGQIVMGGYLRLFTNHHDCEMWHWLERVSLNDVVAKGVPLGLSGRCFQFLTPDRYEPYLEGRVPLVYFSRSSITLSFSTVDVIPSSGLQRYLGWRPVPTNPFKWQREGNVVAQYEVYHAPLHYNWGRRHMRQSTLSRWVVNTEELSTLTDLAPQWDHKVYPFEVE